MLACAAVCAHSADGVLLPCVRNAWFVQMPLRCHKALHCFFVQAQLVEEGLTRSQWFVTGEVDPTLFSDNFAFKDESVATTGIRAYATGGLLRTTANMAL